MREREKREYLVANACAHASNQRGQRTTAAENFCLHFLSLCVCVSSFLKIAAIDDSHLFIRQFHRCIFCIFNTFEMNPKIHITFAFDFFLFFRFDFIHSLFLSTTTATEQQSYTHSYIIMSDSISLCCAMLCVVFCFFDAFRSS